MAISPFYIEWDSFSVLAIAGISGSGKTTTTRLMLCQLLLNDVDIIVCDPHGHIENQSLTYSVKPLEHMFVYPVAIDKQDRLNMIRIAGEEFKKRKENSSACNKKFVLVIDELTSHFLECSSAEIKEQESILLHIANEARKINMRIILIGQNWKQDYIASRSIRSSINAFIFHRIAGDEIKLLVENTPTSIRRDIARLQTGYAYIYNAQHVFIKVKIPNIRLDDIRDFIKEIESRYESRNAQKRNESRKNHDMNHAHSSAEKAINLNYRDSDILLSKKPDIHESRNAKLAEKVVYMRELILGGVSKENTIKIVFDISKGGKYKPYIVASKLYDRVVELIREQGDIM